MTYYLISVTLLLALLLLLHRWTEYYFTSVCVTTDVSQQLFSVRRHNSDI